MKNQENASWQEIIYQTKAKQKYFKFYNKNDFILQHK